MNSWQRTHDWSTLTRAEIASARDAGALAVLTVGSCEQHADHLPVDTDTLSAYRVAMLAADRCGSPHVLVLPPPSFGFSPHHRAWTCNRSPSTVAWHSKRRPATRRGLEPRQRSAGSNR